MARRSRRLGPIAATVALGSLMLGGYTVAAAQAPLAPPVVDIHPEARLSHTVTDDAAWAIVNEQALPTAVGYAHTGDVWSNTEEALPIASFTKLVSMLVALEHDPLSPDLTTWGTHTWTVDDWRRQQEVIADLGVAFPTAVGTEISLVDLLTLIFLPSANDMVAAYVYSVFPDNTAFIDAVDAWAAEHDLGSLRILEPTGLAEGNVATPADVLRIGRMALEHPVISQFIAMESADLPQYGRIENTNPLIGNTPGIIGVKTGRSLSAGFNLIVAQETAYEDRSFTQLSVTMGRESLSERKQSGREMLAMLDTLPTEVDIVHDGAEIGTVTDWQGNVYPITTTASVSTVLLPAETATRSIEHSLTESAQWEGMLLVTAPDETFEVELHTSYQHTEPSLWWRVTHPSIIFQ